MAILPWERKTMRLSVRLPEATIVRFIALTMFTLSLPLLAQQPKPYRGGELRTKTSYTYGRFEVRMRSAAKSGLVSSFFTYHDQDPDPIGNWNEIDIEILGRYENQIQYNTITPGRIDHVKSVDVPFNPHLAFHVYAFEWTPDYVAWFVDGYEMHRQPAPQPHIATLRLPQKIMMNLWQPDYPGWVGTFNPAVLPVYAYYDWVRYYSYTPGTGDNFTLQWTDDFNTWDQSRWDKATHTFDGNNAIFIPENAVFQDGYMILCLTGSTQIGYRGAAIDDKDIDPPYLVWARAFDNKMEVFFSEEVEQTSAEKTPNYHVAGVALTGAMLLPGNKLVELTADSLDSTREHVLVVSGIKDRASPANTMGVKYTTASSALPFPMRINVGGEKVEDFLPDQVWEYKREYGVVGGVPKRIPPGTEISGTTHQAIYATKIEGLSFYQVRVSPGVYRVTLMMAETSFNEAHRRSFDVHAEGRLIFDNLDIFARAGRNAALEISTDHLVVSDGCLDLYFMRDVNVPTLSGLAVERVAATGIDKKGVPPQHFGLHIFPNPAHPAINVEYHLDQTGLVELALYNLNGQLVKSMLNELRAAGTHTMKLEAKDLSAGVYFVRLRFDGELVEARKLVYLK